MGGSCQEEPGERLLRQDRLFSTIPVFTEAFQWMHQAICQAEIRTTYCQGICIIMWLYSETPHERPSEMLQNVAQSQVLYRHFKICQTPAR